MCKVPSFWCVSRAVCLLYVVRTSAYVYVPTGTNLLYMGSLLMQIASIGLNLGVGFTLAMLAKPSIRNWCVVRHATCTCAERLMAV